MKHFMDKIPKGHPWEHLNFVEIALIIIDEDPRVMSHPSLYQSCIGTDRTERLVERSSKSAKTLNASHKSVIVVPVANNADAQGQQHQVTSFTKAPSTRSGGRGGTKEAQNGGAAAKYALSAARKEVRTESGIALFNDVQRLHLFRRPRRCSS